MGLRAWLLAGSKGATPGHHGGIAGWLTASPPFSAGPCRVMPTTSHGALQLQCIAFAIFTFLVIILVIFVIFVIFK